MRRPPTGVVLMVSAMAGLLAVEALVRPSDLGRDVAVTLFAATIVVTAILAFLSAGGVRAAACGYAVVGGLYFLMVFVKAWQLRALAPTRPLVTRITNWLDSSAVIATWELWELRTWSEHQFVVIGHGLFAISLGGLAGLFAALVYERRFQVLPRFSLKQLLFVAIFVCLGAQAVNRHDLFWATLINTLAVSLLGIALLVIVCQESSKRRAFATGFALACGVYLLAAHTSMSDSLVSDRALREVYGWTRSSGGEEDDQTLTFWTGSNLGRPTRVRAGGYDIGLLSSSKEDRRLHIEDTCHVCCGFVLGCLAAAAVLRIWMTHANRQQQVGEQSLVGGLDGQHEIG